jgi:hypothetical protein
LLSRLKLRHKVLLRSSNDGVNKVGRRVEHALNYVKMLLLVLEDIIDHARISLVDRGGPSSDRRLHVVLDLEQVL